MRIATCPSCSEDIRTTDIAQVFSAADSVRMEFDHECGATGSVTVTWPQYREMVREHRAGFGPAESPSEWIGKMVQGMRIELDVVDTPADMLVIWEAQERHEPWTVRKEK